jgi:hypothetical protein
MLGIPSVQQFKMVGRKHRLRASTCCVCTRTTPARVVTPGSEAKERRDGSPELSQGRQLCKSEAVDSRTYSISSRQTLGTAPLPDVRHPLCGAVVSPPQSLPQAEGDPPSLPVTCSFIEQIEGRVTRIGLPRSAMMQKLLSSALFALVLHDRSVLMLLHRIAGRLEGVNKR